jgi:hypothetical protein
MAKKTAKPKPKPTKEKMKPVAVSQIIDIAELKPHPQNYREHPDDQVEHLMESLRENGFYRNVVIAKDNTILAGHGVIVAAKKMGLKTAPCLKLNLDPSHPKALKVLAGDNEIGGLSVVNDRELTELLKNIKDADTLLGSGYDDKMLAALVMITRPAGEIADNESAAHWVGMPEMGLDPKEIKLVMSFRNKEDRAQFVKEKGIKMMTEGVNTWSASWPEKEKDDPASVRFQTGKGKPKK